MRERCNNHHVNTAFAKNIVCINFINDFLEISDKAGQKMEDRKSKFVFSSGQVFIDNIGLKPRPLVALACTQ